MFFNTAYLPWAVLILLSLALSVNSNTIFVLRFAAFNKEMNLEQQIQSVTAEKKKQVGDYTYIRIVHTYKFDVELR